MVAKHKSKEERKAQIMEAALECFYEKGYVNTTIDHIAEKSSLSKGSIYWHFKSKDEIFIESIMFFSITLEKELEMVINSEEPAIAKLRNGFASFIEFQKYNKGLFNLYIEYWAQSKNRDEVKQSCTKFLTMFKDVVKDIIQEGVENKEFKEIDTEQFTWALMATLDGLGAYNALIDDLDFGKIINVYIDTLLAGLEIDNK